MDGEVLFFNIIKTTHETNYTWYFDVRPTVYIKQATSLPDLEKIIV